MSEIVIDERDERVTVSVRHDAGDVPLPALWLRERSTAADALDARTGQRLFDPHLLPVDLSVRSAIIDTDGNLQVLFSDGHQSVFDPRDLSTGLTLGDGLPARVHWSAVQGRPPQHGWDRLDDPAAELAALTDFLVLGVIVIDNVPTVAGTLLQVAARFGYVRDTNFGPLFEVRSEPDSTDLAYRSVALGPHTDNPYRTPVPGIQLLHCLVNDTPGGQSTLVDGLAAVDQLGREDPSAVDMLASVPVRFRYRDAVTDIVTIRPIIERDYSGAVIQLHYSPRLDEMPLMPVGEVERFQAARRRLAQLLADDALQVRFTLASGQVMMFDNNRVLHGRTAFDPNAGLRHLQGCYIDSDGPQARFRVCVRQALAVGQTMRQATQQIIGQNGA